MGTLIVCGRLGARLDAGPFLAILLIDRLDLREPMPSLAAIDGGVSATRPGTPPSQPPATILKPPIGGSNWRMFGESIAGGLAIARHVAVSPSFSLGFRPHCRQR